MTMIPSTSGVTGTTPPASTATSGATGLNQLDNSQTFLQLLVAQLENQDPHQPNRPHLVHDRDRPTHRRAVADVVVGRRADGGGRLHDRLDRHGHRCARARAHRSGHGGVAQLVGRPDPRGASGRRPATEPHPYRRDLGDRARTTQPAREPAQSSSLRRPPNPTRHDPIRPDQPTQFVVPPIERTDQWSSRSSPPCRASRPTRPISTSSATTSPTPTPPGTRPRTPSSPTSWPNRSPVRRPPRPDGDSGVDPIAVGAGVRVGAVTNDQSQGAIQQTNQPTDVAIQGSGFLIADRQGQQFYTRAGNLTLDANGGSRHADGRADPGLAGRRPGDHRHQRPCRGR